MCRSLYTLLLFVSVSQVFAAETGKHRIQQVLKDPVTADFVETPLSDVTMFLADLFKISVMIDQHALDEAEISRDAPVTIAVKGVQLRSLLHLILEPHELTWIVEDNSLVVTTPKVAETQLVVQTYKVRGLTEVSAGEIPDTDSLIEVITSTVHPASWDEVGGPGSVVPFQDLLVIRQSAAIHEQIHDLLTALRLALESSQAGGKKVPESISLQQDVTGDNIREKVGSTMVTVQFQDTPLREVLEYLANTARLTILIDTTALNDAGIENSAPLTVNLENVTLESALRRLLRPMELTYQVHNEVVQITTPEIAESQSIIRRYPVRDLVDYGAGIASADYDSLIETITSIVAPQTWEFVGGPGTLEVYAPAWCLAVRQTAEVHSTIADLLRQLREKHTTLTDEQKAQAQKLAEQREQEICVDIYHYVGEGESPAVGEIVELLQEVLINQPLEFRAVGNRVVVKYRGRTSWNVRSKAMIILQGFQMQAESTGGFGCGGLF